MRTRSSARNQLVIERVIASKVSDLENQKITTEIWLKEGVVINPEIKDPSTGIINKWKLFVVSAYNHPNILAHQDFQCIRDLFQFFEVYIEYETSHVIVEFNDSWASKVDNEDTSSLHLLHPNGEFEDGTDKSLACVFGVIENFEVIPNLNAAVIREYTIIQDLKLSLSELVEFVWTYPEALLYDNFYFIYEFLVKFGVSPDIITNEIFQTQCRRAQNKYPASTLLLKLGVPESESTEVNIHTNSLHFVNNDTASAYNNMQISTTSRHTSGSLSEDSGIESWDNFDSSTTHSDLDSTDFKVPTNPIFAKKSTVTLEPVEPSYSIIEDEVSDSEKPFKCTTCSRRYITKGNCNWHIRKRHPGSSLLPGSKLVTPSLSFSCPFCGKAFTYPQYVTNHIERLHPESASGSRKPIRSPQFKFISSKSNAELYEGRKYSASSRNHTEIRRRSLGLTMFRRQREFTTIDMENF